MSQEEREIVDSNSDRIHKAHYAVTSSTSVESDPWFKVSASWSNGSRIRMIPGEVFETNDGTYKITYQSGPLSCSVAGGMTLLTTFPDGTSENVFYPPGYSCEKIDNLPSKQQPQYISSGVSAELWKEAIEDAKKVRKKALENAKEALEEAFADHPKFNTIKQRVNSDVGGSPEDLVVTDEVPVEKDGDKIEVGGKIVLNRKSIEKLIGVNNKSKSNPEEDAILRRQPVAGRNAFEIRSDILQMALDYATHNKSRFTPEEIVGVAKKFYAFVENKR
jgi:hypothetical protein